MGLKIIVPIIKAERNRDTPERKPLVSSGFPLLLLTPPDTRTGERIDGWRVWFDVNEWRSIQCIQAVHLHKAPITFQKIDDTQPDRVGTIRRSGRENPVYLRPPRRSCLQDASITPILPVEHIEVRAPLDVEKPGCVFLEYLYGALLIFVSALVRRSLFLCIGGMNHPNRLQKSFFSFSFRQDRPP